MTWVPEPGRAIWADLPPATPSGQQPADRGLCAQLRHAGPHSRPAGTRNPGPLPEPRPGGPVACVPELTQWADTASSLGPRLGQTPCAPAERARHGRVRLAGRHGLGCALAAGLLPRRVRTDWWPVEEFVWSLSVQAALIAASCMPGRHAQLHLSTAGGGAQTCAAKPRRWTRPPAA